jgi:hypothetical protein
MRTPLENFIVQKVNQDRKTEMPLWQISRSIREVWTALWDNMTERERKIYNN